MPSLNVPVGRARWALAAAAGVTAAVLANRFVARRTERRHPPAGRFVTASGVRLHYLEAGTGPNIVLLHGNGVAADDFVVSGVMGELARIGRVIAFDRPGFGYSERPRGAVWSARAQARLLLDALELVEGLPAVVIGHSWGATVAAEMALAARERISALVLMSGYYRPTPRLDAVLLGAPAVPFAGDLMRYTVSPPVGALITPLVLDRLFAPAPVSERFRRAYPISMSLRPSQLRASAAESALLISDATRLASRVGEITAPTLLLAGADDRLLSTLHHSGWLSEQLPGSEFVELPGVGHMIHHTAPQDVLAAIEGFIMGQAAGASATIASAMPSAGAEPSTPDQDPLSP